MNSVVNFLPQRAQRKISAAVCRLLSAVSCVALAQNDFLLVCREHVQFVVKCRSEIPRKRDGSIRRAGIVVFNVGTARRHCSAGILNRQINPLVGGLDVLKCPNVKAERCRVGIVAVGIGIVRQPPVSAENVMQVARRILGFQIRNGGDVAGVDRLGG